MNSHTGSIITGLASSIGLSDLNTYCCNYDNYHRRNAVQKYPNDRDILRTQYLTTSSAIVSVCFQLWPTDRHPRSKLQEDA